MSCHAIPKKSFPGTGPYVESAARAHSVTDAEMGWVRSDPLLEEIGDLIGQAYAHGPGETARAVVAEAARRVRALDARLTAAESILADAEDDLGPVRTKPISTHPKG